MIIRSGWLENTDDTADLFYTVNETIDSVKTNFDIRRYNSAEGKSVEIDGTTEQVIIQDHTNPINENKRDKKLLIPIDSVALSGSYVLYNGLTWMIISRINNVDNAYKSCQIQECNYVIKFQQPLTGTILSYPCIDDSASLTVGIDDGKVISTGNAIHTIKLPFDAETIQIREGKRFFLDRHTVDPRVYKVTKVNSTEYAYGDKGLIELTLEQDESQSSNDRVDLWICNYFEPGTIHELPDPEIPTVVVTVVSDATDNKVKLGITYTFTAMFTNELGETISTTLPRYTIDNDYGGKIALIDNSDGTCTVIVNFDTNLLGKQFTLKCMELRSGFWSSVLLTIAGLY